jgi:hypothetical protein
MTGPHSYLIDPLYVLPDGAPISFGGVASIFWESADANANYLAFELPAGGSVDVPVSLFGIGLDGVDLGLFNGVTMPTLGIMDADRDTALVMDYSGDDAARIRTLGSTRDLTIAPTGDLTLNPADKVTISNGDLLLKSDDGGATGPIIQLYHDTASASATGGQDTGDRLGVIDFLDTSGTIFGEISCALEGSTAQAGFHFRLKGDATNDKLYISRDGNATLSGTLTESSDERLKENVATLTSSLAKVTQMRGVSFTRKDFTDKTQKHIGLIAQELESIAPELVATGSDGFKSVAYSQLVAYLIEATKELKAEIDELKSRE